MEIQPIFFRVMMAGQEFSSPSESSVSLQSKLSADWRHFNTKLILLRHSTNQTNHWRGKLLECEMKKLSTNQITTFYSISVFFKEIHRKASLQEKFHIQWIILLLCKFLSGFQVKTLEYFNNIKYFPQKKNNFRFPVFYNSVVMRNIIKYPRIVPKPLIYWFTDTDI